MKNFINILIVFFRKIALNVVVFLEIIAGIIAFLLLLFLFIDYPIFSKLIHPKVLTNYVARELNIDNYYIRNKTEESIANFYTEYKNKKKINSKYGDEFDIVLMQLSKNRYHDLLISNLKITKKHIPHEQYIELQKLYSNLFAYWLKLYSGIYGTNTAEAFHDYYKIINLSSGKFINFRKHIRAISQNNHEKNKDIQQEFRNLYTLPVSSLIFEIYLRTLHLTIDEANDKIISRSKTIFNIVSKDYDITFNILETKGLNIIE